MDKGKARKRVKGPENPDVDQCVLKWFKHAHDKKIPLVRVKAEEFSSSLGKKILKRVQASLMGLKTEMEFPSKQFLVKVVLLTWPLQMIGKTC